MSGADSLSPLKRALVELRELRAQLARAERVRIDPVAIVGVGLRLPGGLSTPDEFWDFLLRGGDAITEVPSDRWSADAFSHSADESCGTIVTRFGGFLRGIDQFDARFFGITPREAASMDPQQRLLLEASWEALEHGGQAPDALLGSRTGVFMGVGSADYLGAGLKFTPIDDIDAYLASGGVPSVIAGRLAYVLGLQGPALTVDTACSSSLAAVHLAVQSLRLGECDMAIAGGANVLLLPELSVNCSRANMLAPDGRCKTFDSRADGYVRSEGCGVVVLKRLSDAVAARDRVLAVIRGSALNQDGRSSGLTVPNGLAQESVIREALRNAAVRPDEVGYVEAHGTGTALGDPIELRALGSVFNVGRDRDTPLIVGSVKTNVGHLEAAAGITSLIKVALSLSRSVIPPHLHLQQPTPHVNWNELALSVPTAPVPWAAGRARYAGVSSFGFSGTNAHLILGEGPDVTLPAAASRPLHVLTLSAKSSRALTAAAGRLANHLVNDAPAIADLCHTANAGRPHFSERAAMIVTSVDDARIALQELSEGRHAPGVVRTTAPARGPEVAFLFAGLGVQDAGMGRELFETQPIFRRTLVECDELLRPYLERPLLSILYPADGEPSLIDDPRYGQPVVFAFEYALAAMWQAWGVAPAYVLGHSLGEDVAACVAGVFTLGDGLAMVARRARLMHEGTRPGAMVAVFADDALVAAQLARSGTAVVVAARNGPQAVVISGPSDEVSAAAQAFAAQGVKTRALKSTLACHAPQMDSILDAVEELARTTPMRAPRIGVVSTLTGRVATAAEICDPRYWRRHIREVVRFAEALEGLHQAGPRVFLEIGPRATVSAMGRRSLQSDDVTWLQSLHREGRDWQQVAETMQTLYAKGVKVDWAAFGGDYATQKVALPSYPFQRERHWSDAIRPRQRVEPRWSPRGRRLRSPALSGVVFQSAVDLESCPMLADHRVKGQILAPGGLFVEALLGADPARPVVAELNIESPLVVPANGSRLLQVSLNADDATFAIESAPAEDETGEWTRHATGRLEAVTQAPRERVVIDVAAIRGRMESTTGGDVVYAQLGSLGFEMGSRFRAIRGVEHRPGESLGRLEVPEHAGQGRWTIHPALFDAAVQTALCALPARTDGLPYIFTGCDRLVHDGVVPPSVFSHFVAEPASETGAAAVRGSLRICDEGGNVVVEATGLQFRALRRHGSTHGEFVDSRLHEVVWQARPLETGSQPAERGPAGDTSRSIASVLHAAVPAMADGHQLRAYGVALDDVERRATAYIVRALLQLGVPPAPGSRFSVSWCISQLGVLPKYRRLMTRLLRILEADQIVERHGDDWIVRRALTAPALAPAAADLATAERALTDRCGGELAHVLRGDADPLAVLFPGGSTADLEAIYQRSAPARFANDLLATAMRELAGALPQGRTLRVLEVGAGTGGTTRSLLPLLPADRTRYVFTDLSRAFLDRAADQFGAYPFVEFRTLDLDRDPREQGFGGRQFDVIVGVNVIHATANLRQTLRRLHSLLSPGGLLLMTEAIVPQRWLDITFGLTEGWWRFEDVDVRSDHPLLDRPAWLAALASCGFAGAQAVPPPMPGLPEANAVFVSAADAAIDNSSVSSWLVLADGGGVGDAVAARLRERGGAVTLVRNSRTASGQPADAVVDPADDAALDLLVKTSSPTGGCINLWPLDAPALDRLSPASIEGAWEPGALALLHLAQSVVRCAASAPIWTVTRGALGESATHAAAATVWGMGRVLALEHPDEWGGLIELGEASAAVSADRVVSDVLGGDGEDQIVWRDNQRHVARLVKVGRVPVSKVTVVPDATYLITGGLGQLGLEIARGLVERGARHLTLISRSGLARERRDAEPGDASVAARLAAVRALEEMGAQVRVVAADVADTAAMAGVFGEFGTVVPPLRGIVHAAHEAGTARLSAMTAATLRAMLRPKVTGTLVLHELSAAMPLDFFVLFSSTTGLIGSIALAHYAAANTFLDAFAHAQRAAGRPVTAIAWGAWQDLRIASTEVRRAMDASGLKVLPMKDGVAAFGELMGAERPNPVFVDADWGKLRTAYESRRPRPMLAELGAPAAAARDAVAPDSDVRRRLAGAGERARHELVSQHVLREVAHVVRVGADEIDPAQGLFDLGMDSLMAVELRSRLERSLGLKLPSTLTFNYPSVQAIAAYLVPQLTGDDAVSTRTAAMAPGSAASAPKAATSAVALDELSEHELAEMLARTLTELK